MFRKILLLLFILLGVPIWAQEPPKTVVGLEASQGGKLPLAFSNSSAGLDTAVVQNQFEDVVRKNLSLAWIFKLLPPGLNFNTNPVAFDAWQNAGADLLLVTQLKKNAQGEIQLEARAYDTRAKKDIFGKSYQGTESALRRMAHRLVDELLERITGERGIADSRIIFVKEIRSGVKEIFQVERDGSGLRQITHHGGLAMSPTLCRSGRLAYILLKEGAAIYGQRKPGGPVEKLYPLQSASGNVGSPAWSPDGSRLAFTQTDNRGNSDILILDPTTGRTRKLTGGSGINTEPSWSPSGNQMAFTSDREGTPQIFLMEVDGSNVRRLTFEGGYNASPAWSPNGAQIAYVSRFEGKFDLFIYKLGEGKAYQITKGVASSESPSWSPDERCLVYTSGRGPGSRLVITDLSGNEVQPLAGSNGGQSPRWTRSR